MATTQTKTQSVKALVFEQGGAPATPHWFPNVPGLFVPGVPVVIGGPGEITEAHAAELDAGESFRLVDVSQDEAAELRELSKAQLQAHKQGVKAFRQTNTVGLEVAHVRDAQTQATKKVD